MQVNLPLYLSERVHTAVMSAISMKEVHGYLVVYYINLINQLLRLVADCS